MFKVMLCIVGQPTPLWFEFQTYDAAFQFFSACKYIYGGDSVTLFDSASNVTAEYDIVFHRTVNY
jgi:hypothetical protein